MAQLPDSVAAFERTAEELRAALLIRENKGANKKQRILNHALVDPTVTGMEYKVLSLELKHTDEHGAGCYLKPESGAKILGCSVDTYERALKRLIEGKRTKQPGGWGTRARRYNNTSMRSYTISPHTLRVTETAKALLDILEQGRETADLRIQSNETADLRIQSGRETANLRERNRKSAALTPSFNPRDEEEEHTQRAPVAFASQNGSQGEASPSCQATTVTAAFLAELRAVADAWGRKPGDAGFNPLPLASVEREVADLRGESQGFSAETVKAALAEAHSELANMVASGSVQPGTNWKGALAYFRKTFRSARDRLHQAAIDLKTAADTAQAIAAEKLSRERAITEKTGAAFDASVARNAESAPRPRKEASPRVSSTAERFPDDAKVEDVRGEFEVAWEAYRKARARSPGSKPKALAQFERLAPEDRALVIPAIKAYAADREPRHMADMDRFFVDFFEQFKPEPEAPEVIERRQVQAVALDLAYGEQPERIKELKGFGWQTFEDVMRQAPKIWKAGCDLAERESDWKPSARFARAS